MVLEDDGFQQELIDEYEAREVQGGRLIAASVVGVGVLVAIVWLLTPQHVRSRSGWNVEESIVEAEAVDDGWRLEVAGPAEGRVTVYRDRSVGFPRALRQEKQPDEGFHWSAVDLEQLDAGTFDQRPVFDRARTVLEFPADTAPGEPTVDLVFRVLGPDDDYARWFPARLQPDLAGQPNVIYRRGPLHQGLYLPYVRYAHLRTTYGLAGAGLAGLLLVGLLAGGCWLSWRNAPLGGSFPGALRALAGYVLAVSVLLILHASVFPLFMLVLLSLFGGGLVLLGIQSWSDIGRPVNRWLWSVVFLSAVGFVAASLPQYASRDILTGMLVLSGGVVVLLLVQAFAWLGAVGEEESDILGSVGVAAAPLVFALSVLTGWWPFV